MPFGAVNMERLNLVKSIIDRATEFVEQVYIPDLLAIASFYKGWLYGGGISSKNLLSYGDIPNIANDYTTNSLLLPRGAIINGKLDEIHPVRPERPGAGARIRRPLLVKYPDETKGLHPFDGVTEPNFVLGPKTKGTKTNIKELDEGGKNSWIKAPRWRGHAMEVGPLAHMVMGYLSSPSSSRKSTAWSRGR